MISISDRGLLRRGSTPEVRQSSINETIGHLEKEIRSFAREIQKVLGDDDECND